MAFIKRTRRAVSTSAILLGLIACEGPEIVEPPGPLGESPAQQPQLAMRFSNQAASRGTIVTGEFVADLANAEVVGVQAILRYDSEKLELLQYGSDQADFVWADVEQTDGASLLVAASRSPFTRSSIASLVFRVLGVEYAESVVLDDIRVVEAAELGSRAALVSSSVAPSSATCSSVSEDQNKDGEIDVLDLVLVVNHLGETGPAADINLDGSVDVLDLVLIVNAMNGAAGHRECWLTITAAGAFTGLVRSTPAGIDCVVQAGQTVTDNCDAYFPQGANVSLTTTPATGSAFVGWDPAECPLAASLNPHSACNLSLSGDVAVTARFEERGFDIEVRPTPGTTLPQGWTAEFDAAAARWEKVLHAGLADYPGPVPSSQCVTGAPDLNEAVDDIIIFVHFADLSSSGASADARPCLNVVRGNLPIVGVVRFDIATVGAPLSFVRRLMTHEIGHVLAFHGNVEDPDGRRLFDFGGDPHFAGLLAQAAFDDVGGAAYAGLRVPLEAGPHWRASVFVAPGSQSSEVMDPGAGPALSIVTVAALADLGYFVDITQADSYALP